MVNFMCQLDWTMWCQDIWLNTILSVSVWGCFWMRLTFESVDWVNQMALPNVGGRASSNPVKAWIELKGWVRDNSLSLLDCLLAGTLVISCLRTQSWNGIYTISSPGSQAFVLRLKPTTDSPGSLGLQPDDCRSWDFSVSIVVWANSFIIWNIGYTIGSVSLEYPD